MKILLLGAALLACGCASAQVQPGPSCVDHISDEEAADIGRRIWQHESSGKLLIWWDDTCDCPSMGINNYLWFPPGHTAPFEESFLALLRHMRSRGVELPDQLKSLPDAPWRTRQEMFAEVATVDWARRSPPAAWGMTPSMFTTTDSPRVKELKEFLARTVNDQVRFSAQRMIDSLPKMLAAVPPAQRPEIERQFYRVACSKGGLFDLVDYVNFKGEGTSPKERYPGPDGEAQGWGLLQVLQGMSGERTGPSALGEFADSAERVIKRRVDNAARAFPDDPARAEKERATWLPIWLRRIQSYRGS